MAANRLITCHKSFTVCKYLNITQMQRDGKPFNINGYKDGVLWVSFVDWLYIFKIIKWSEKWYDVDIVLSTHIVDQSL